MINPPAPDELPASVLRDVHDRENRGLHKHKPASPHTDRKRSTCQLSGGLKDRRCALTPPSFRGTREENCFPEFRR